MVIFIKNMIAARCKLIIQLEVEHLGLTCDSIEFGKVVISGEVSSQKIQQLSRSLLRSGLQVMEDKRSVLIEKIKQVIMEMVHGEVVDRKVNFSSHLSQKLDLNYTYLANVFSEDEGITIERFLILQKIQKVKELIRYDELSLTEISWKLRYSSVAHLSTQFKNITGQTPSQFKTLERLSHVLT
jgi:AraC-like DNA-binding protein